MTSPAQLALLDQYHARGLADMNDYVDTVVEMLDFFGSTAVVSDLVWSAMDQGDWSTEHTRCIAAVALTELARRKLEARR